MCKEVHELEGIMEPEERSARSMDVILESLEIGLIKEFSIKLKDDEYHVEAIVDYYEDGIPIRSKGEKLPQQLSHVAVGKEKIHDFLGHLHGW